MRVYRAKQRVVIVQDIVQTLGPSSGLDWSEVRFPGREQPVLNFEVCKSNGVQLVLFEYRVAEALQVIQLFRP